MVTKSLPRQAGAKTTCVAVDISASAVRVVEMEWTPSSGTQADARLLKRGMAALPPHAWTELPASQPLFVAAIREALSSAGIVSRNVVACFPRQFVTLRLVRLPHAPPDQMRGMVTLEAQQHILFSLDEVILDFYQIPGLLPGFSAADTDDLETVLLAAARRSLIADIMAIFEQAGLELEKLTVSALALSELIHDSLEPTALVDIKPGEIDVVVVSEGHLLFSRASSLDVRGMVPEVAERRLSEEFARSFTAYQNEYRNRPPSRVLVAGAAGAGLDSGRVEAALSDVLDMPVSLLQNRLFAPGDNDVRSYAAAIGTAMQVHGPGVAPINLVPNERALRRAQQARTQRQRLAWLVAGLLGIVVLVLVQHSLAAQAALQAATLQSNKDLNEVQDRLTARKKVYDGLQALDTAVATGLDRKHPSVDVLTALSQSLPKTNNIWLTQLGFERGGTLTLRGNTKTESAATDLVINLQQSGFFRNVQLGYLGDTDDTNQPAQAPTATAQPKAAASTLPGLPPPGPTPGAPPLPGGLPAMPAGPGLPGLPAPGAITAPGTGRRAATGSTSVPRAVASAAVTKPAIATKTVGSTIAPTKPAMATLTSFVITCRLNPSAGSLIVQSKSVPDTATRPKAVLGDRPPTTAATTLTTAKATNPSQTRKSQ